MSISTIEHSLCYMGVEPPDKEVAYAVKFIDYLMPSVPLATWLREVKALMGWGEDYILANAKQFDPMVEIAIRQEYVATLLVLEKSTRKRIYFS